MESQRMEMMSNEEKGMDFVNDEKREPVELAAPLEIFPPIDFCCVYGSSLLRNNNDKTSMVDYIFGVQDPISWHSQNLEINSHHYSRWMSQLGPKAVTWVADEVGVGVHFNPFVEWKDKRLKYGVVRMHDLNMDLLTWDRFYLSGRLQKPVKILIDNCDIQKANLINLKAAISASLLLLPAQFNEEDLYAKICSLSYMGDLRMLFAEDKNKIKNIVHGSFELFQFLYKPLLKDCMTEGLLKVSQQGYQEAFEQDYTWLATSKHISYLPAAVQSRLGMERNCTELGTTRAQMNAPSRELATNCMAKVLKRRVMVSSARQALSGLIATGGVNAASYLARKISKAWKSRTS